MQDVQPDRHIYAAECAETEVVFSVASPKPSPRHGCSHAASLLGWQTEWLLLIQKKRNLHYLLKRTLCSFSYPHFYISKLRVSVCFCKTSQTLKPQPRGRARSLQPWSVILKNTLSENVRIHLTYSSNYVFIILFFLWAIESIKSEKCCSVYIQTCWLLLVLPTVCRNNLAHFKGSAEGSTVGTRWDQRQTLVISHSMWPRWASAGAAEPASSSVVRSTHKPKTAAWNDLSYTEAYIYSRETRTMAGNSTTLLEQQ